MLAGVSAAASLSLAGAAGMAAAPEVDTAAGLATEPGERLLGVAMAGKRSESSSLKGSA